MPGSGPRCPRRICRCGRSSAWHAPRRCRNWSASCCASGTPPAAPGRTPSARPSAPDLRAARMGAGPALHRARRARGAGRRAGGAVVRRGTGRPGKRVDAAPGRAARIRERRRTAISSRAERCSRREHFARLRAERDGDRLLQELRRLLEGTRARYRPRRRAVRPSLARAACGVGPDRLAPRPGPARSPRSGGGALGARADSRRGAGAPRHRVGRGVRRPGRRRCTR